MAYVYGHYTADTDKLFYIGKGVGNRAWSKKNRNPYWINVTNKHGYTIKILYENLTEEEAYIKEKELIAEIGLDNLTNLSEGGKGWTSADLRRLYENPDHLQKITEANRRNAQTPEWKRKHKEVREQLKADPQWHKKISDGLKKKYEDPAHLQKVTEANRRNAQSPEWQRKQKEIRQTPEFKQKHTAAVREATQTPEWKQKHKEAQKEVGNRPEVRQQRSIRRKQLLEDPEWYSKFLQSHEHRKQQYTFLSPSGEITHVTGLTQFCKQHGLTGANMLKVLRGERLHHKGWKRYEPDHPINQFIEDTSP